MPVYSQYDVICVSGVSQNPAYVKTSAFQSMWCSPHLCSLLIVLISFSVALIKLPWEKQLKQERIPFGSQFKGIDHHGEGNQGNRNVRELVISHLQPGSRELRMLQLSCLCTFFFFLIVWDLSPGNGATHSGCVLLCQLTQLRNFLIDVSNLDNPPGCADGLSPRWLCISLRWQLRLTIETMINLERIWYLATPT